LGQANVDRSENLEQAARHARQDFYRGFLESGTLDRIALGHTRSDQAETVLFRILRGAGTAGLAGIRPVTREGIVRPLLAVDRREAEEYLLRLRVRWREDSTNLSMAFARNRIRHELLPTLTRDWNPKLTHTLADMAGWALDEQSYWEAETSRLENIRITRRSPAAFIRADQLAEMPRAVARRLVRRAMERSKGDLLGIDFGHVEAILALALPEQGSGRLQIPGLDVFRSFDWIRLAPPGCTGERDFRIELAIPDDVQLPGGDSRIQLNIVTANSGYTVRMSDLDRDRISGPLTVRNWRPGDQYRPFRSERPEKLKTLFQQARVPLWERRRWPVITSGDSILWTRRFGPSRDVAATEGSRLVLRIQEIDNVES
jgi:tRNA(Ile)-lysidine synthase